MSDDPLKNSRHAPSRWKLARRERGDSPPPAQPDWDTDALFDPSPADDDAPFPRPATDPPVPVVNMADDDPQLKQAVAEANSRFDEFLSALAARGPADTFAVKAPFLDDFGREFMWLNVSRVDGTHIYGELDNDPARVRTVRRGYRVRVPRALLNDWLYVRNTESHGGFTIRLIEQRMRAAHGAA